MNFTDKKGKCRGKYQYREIYVEFIENQKALGVFLVIEDPCKWQETPRPIKCFSPIFLFANSFFHLNLFYWFYYRGWIPWCSYLLWLGMPLMLQGESTILFLLSCFKKSLSVTCCTIQALRIPLILIQKHHLFSAAYLWTVWSGRKSNQTCRGW